jgi:hypothetical protein
MKENLQRAKNHQIGPWESGMILLNLPVLIQSFHDF